MVSEIKHITRLGIGSVLLNVVLSVVKIGAGILGNSYALVADGVESGTDILTSMVTWLGFRLSLRPPDVNHPFGHGKIESLAGLFSGLALLAAAALIAVQSIHEIRTPHSSPEWFTLPVLMMVVVTKLVMSRYILTFADSVDSRALEGDAWHHISDAITSTAAGIGISIALIGGSEWAVADDWAALIACAVIVYNGFRIISRSLHETLDGKVDPRVGILISREAQGVEGVLSTEKCLVRKSGTHYFAELHVQVDGNVSVTAGHRIAHRVKEHLLEKTAIPLQNMVVHIEPFNPED